jgi:DNA-binding response OmpR family regulator
MRVLIVEDDYASSEMLRISLAKEGYSCRQASDGKEGLELFASYKPDILISDIIMPGLDGMQLLKEIRAVNKELVIIMLTGHGNEELALSALEHGANNYLKKPVILPELKTLLKRYSNILESKKMAQELPKLIKERSLRLMLPTDTNILPSVVDYFQDKISLFYTAKQLFQIELGLSELLTNAVEHGNLSITNDEKNSALSSNKLDELYSQRMGCPEYSCRKVEVVFVQTEEYCSWSITDEGCGFNWRSLPNPTHGRHIGELHGRGVFLSKMQFDELVYSEKGNSVTAKKYYSND